MILRKRTRRKSFKFTLPTTKRELEVKPKEKDNVEKDERAVQKENKKVPEHYLVVIQKEEMHTR